MRKIVPCLLALLLLAACGGADPSEESAGVMSSFTATDLSGEDVDETVLQDHVLTMVNVWATYCGPCIREMPELGELAEEYAEKDVQILGLVIDTLNSDGSVSAAQVEIAGQIAAETGADYTHLLPSDSLFPILEQVSAVPTTFFVDDTGRQIGDAYIGARSRKEWSAVIDKLLAEVQP